MSFRFYTNLISSTSRSVVAGIFPRLIAGPERNRDRPQRDAANRTQSEFRFALADPPLAGMKVVGHELRGLIYNTKPI